MRKIVVLIAASFMLLLANSAWSEATVKANTDGATATVTFSTKASGVKEVSVAGTFNGWNTTATPMDKGADGTWTATVQAKLDEVILYKFLLDGTWTPDPNAPDSDPDPYGGKNGKIDITAILSAGAAPVAAAAVPTDGSAAPAAAPAAPAVVAKPKAKMIPLSFSTYTIFASDTKFLTKDKATSKIEGYDFDSEFLSLKSYNKILGDILPGVNVYFEMPIEGSMRLYQSNTLGSEIPFATAADGLQTVWEGFFHPISAFADPAVGHLKIRATSDFLTLLMGFKNSQNSGHNILVFNTVKADNAGKGFLEIGMGDSLKNAIQGVNLDVVLGPNKRSGNGVYSWYTVGFGDFSVDAVYNMKSNAVDMFDFFDDWTAMGAIGGSAKLGPLTLKLQALTDLGSLMSAEGYKFLDYSAAGLVATFKQDAISAELTYKLAGTKATTIYGDDGSLNTGKMFIGLSDSISLDPLSFGIDGNMKTTSDFANIATNDINFWAKPHVYVDLGGFLPFKLGVDLVSSMNVDLLAGTKFGYKLNDIGLKLNASKLGDIVTGASLMYGFNFKYQGYDDTDLFYPFDMMFNSVLATVNFKDNMNASVGVVVRSLLKEFATDAELQGALDAQSPIGFSLGWSYLLPIDELKKPTLYVTYMYNCDPFDNAQEGFKLADNTFRPDSLEGASGESHVRVGLRWSF